MESGRFNALIWLFLNHCEARATEKYLVKLNTGLQATGYDGKWKRGIENVLLIPYVGIYIPRADSICNCVLL